MRFAAPACSFAYAALLLVCGRGAVAGDDGNGSPAPARSPAGTARDDDVATWEGFLWFSPEGWMRMGVPLVTESFKEGQPLVVEPPLRSRLTSIDGAVPRFVTEPAFWYGSELARDDWEPQRKGEPRILVKLRGRAESTIVHLSLPDESPRFGDSLAPDASPVSLRDAHLVAIERLDPMWLAAWRTIFRAEGSPWAGSNFVKSPSTEARAAFLKVAIDALGVMRAVSAPDADLLLLARKIDSDVRSSTKFRHRVEAGIQLRVVAEAKDLRITLPASLADRMLPPWSDTPRWFEDAKTRTGFLARAALNWKGEPEDFEVGYHESDGRGDAWPQFADLETIRNAWSDARYVKIRATTLAMAALGKKR